MSYVSLRLSWRITSSRLGNNLGGRKITMKNAGKITMNNTKKTAEPKIETTIPVPVSYKNYSLLDELAVGESTTFPLAVYNTLGSCITFRQRRFGKKFT